MLRTLQAAVDPERPAMGRDLLDIEQPHPVRLEDLLGREK